MTAGAVCLVAALQTPCKVESVGTRCAAGEGGEGALRTVLAPVSVIHRCPRGLSRTTKDFSRVSRWKIQSKSASGKRGVDWLTWLHIPEESLGPLGPAAAMLSSGSTVCPFPCSPAEWLHSLSCGISMAVSSVRPLASCANTIEKGHSFLRAPAQSLGVTRNWTSLRFMPTPNMAWFDPEARGSEPTRITWSPLPGAWMGPWPASTSSGTGFGVFQPKERSLFLDNLKKKKSPFHGALQVSKKMSFYARFVLLVRGSFHGRNPAFLFWIIFPPPFVYLKLIIITCCMSSLSFWQPVSPICFLLNDVWETHIFLAGKAWWVVFYAFVHSV